MLVKSNLPFFQTAKCYPFKRVKKTQTWSGQFRPGQEGDSRNESPAFYSFFSAAKQLKEEGAEIVIALTHMRWNNDRRLTEHSQYIDMVLGGHDHNYGLEYVSQLPQYPLKSSQHLF